MWHVLSFSLLSKTKTTVIQTWIKWVPPIHSSLSCPVQNRQLYAHCHPSLCTSVFPELLSHRDIYCMPSKMIEAAYRHHRNILFLCMKDVLHPPWGPMVDSLGWRKSLFLLPADSIRRAFPYESFPIFACWLNKSSWLPYLSALFKTLKCFCLLRATR